MYLINFFSMHLLQIIIVLLNINHPLIFSISEIKYKLLMVETEIYTLRKI